MATAEVKSYEDEAIDNYFITRKIRGNPGVEIHRQYPEPKYVKADNINWFPSCKENMAKALGRKPAELGLRRDFNKKDRK